MRGYGRFEIAAVGCGEIFKGVPPLGRRTSGARVTHSSTPPRLDFVEGKRLQECTGEIKPRIANVWLGTRIFEYYIKCFDH
ncbi:hypothetical protein EVAR_86562_1 [Eumeta japonica]|uniref:Uncharacterized protein n=1 Tax=Eumeta variegata TaxID=151549 RepID=A0A4C2A6W5_EUMVA|nr:hypothetical protein EVAR_86562_1 [Eumeta japonica]